VTDAPTRIAVFVTPHGFGHAARACAVVEALAERLPIEVELFTTVPRWFFADSLSVPFEVHSVRTDIGLAQRDALDEDAIATADELDAFLPWTPELLASLAARVRAAGCAAVLCDVAPLGIAVAHAAGLRAALIENFTWDWIYQPYLAREPRLAPHAAELARWFDSADLTIQTRPVCRPRDGAVTVDPVARLPRRAREEVRAELAIRDDERAVLVTMGGIPWDYASLVAGEGPLLPRGVVLVVPGGAPEPVRLSWARLLPFHSTLFHPDLVAAADAVVGKLGYSTLAECWGSGVPFGFVPRETFPESPVLASALERAGAGTPVAASRLRASSWEWLEGVLTLRRAPARPRGNRAAAEALEAWLSRQSRPAPASTG
jgi:UDP:flavonoid glycosyltransferase YjiC (YdhE family)